jgi:lambda family phage portal protein
MQIQVLEPDMIDSLKEGDLPNGGFIVQGIEFDAIGRRVAYWLFQRHPGDMVNLSSSFGASKRVPASEIAHIYRADRPGQVRGVPWLAPVMIRLHDFDQYEDAQLLRQKIAACFTAFIHDMEAPVDSTKKKKVLSEKLEPGAIEILPPGKDIKFNSPPGVEGYSEYASQMLHAIAAGMGITFEALTSDYSQVNYSSARMGWLEFQRNIEQWRWNMMIPQFCETAWDWFVEAATLAGRKTKGASASWTPPRREMIDPTKEIPAIRDAVRVGLTSISESIRENGSDAEAVLQQIADDNKMIDSLGLVLDSDGRKVARSGMAQLVSPTEGEK